MIKCISGMVFRKANQRKHSIVDNVPVVGFQAFRYKCLAGVVFYLFDSQQFLKNEVGHTADAHQSPCFIVVMVFGLKQTNVFGNVEVVECCYTRRRHLQRFIVWQSQLDERQHTVIYQSHKFAFDWIRHLLYAFLFDAADAEGFDVELVCDASGPQDTPCRAVIGSLF